MHVKESKIQIKENLSNQILKDYSIWKRAATKRLMALIIGIPEPEPEPERK